MSHFPTWNEVQIIRWIQKPTKSYKWNKKYISKLGLRGHGQLWRIKFCKSFEKKVLGEKIENLFSVWNECGRARLCEIPD